MPKYCGKDFLIQLEDPALTFTTLGGLEANSLTINNEQVDVTDKGGMPWRELLDGCGIRSMSVSGNGFVTDQATFEKFMLAVINGPTIVDLRLVSGLGDRYDGLFQVASLERGGEKNGAETFTLSLESAGAIVYTPAP
jgi:TP901-1 family phage major tail protein